MTKAKRLKRNEPNDQNETTETTKIVYKKINKTKMNTIFISFRLWSTPNLSHGEIQLSIYYYQLGVRRRENHIEKKSTKKNLLTKMLSLKPLSVSSSPYAMVFNLAGVSS